MGAKKRFEAVLLLILFVSSASSFCQKNFMPLKARTIMAPLSQQAFSCPVRENGKNVNPVPWSVFLATTAFLPVWAVTVLPLSLSYQFCKRALQPLFRTEERLTSLDSGYVVDASQVTPREERKYDVVVLGATGFVGRLAARYLAMAYGVGKDVKWAIAGRSQQKLDAVKKSLSQELGMEDLQYIDTIVVDTSVPSTLPSLVANARVVATTVGPYGVYGSPVVEFCAKFGTHYVDITGEHDWVQAMIQQWQETAQKTGSKLIPFCGHDSIPWDLSLFKLQELLKQECDDDVKTVSFWDIMRAGPPGGTIATLLTYVEGKSIKVPKSDFDPFLRLPDGSKSNYVLKDDLPSFIGRSRAPFERLKDSSQPWTYPFVMAGVNAKVARWSHALGSTGSQEILYREYGLSPDFKTAVASFAFVTIGFSMMLNPLTKPLVMRFLPKPGDGPSMSAMEQKHYLCVKGEAVGAKGNRAESIMYFDKDAGCLETARMLVESSLCLVLEEEKLPMQKGSGGFWPPAAAFGNVLLDRLIASGTLFKSRIVGQDHSKL